MTKSIIFFTVPGDPPCEYPPPVHALVDDETDANDLLPFPSGSVRLPKVSVIPCDATSKYFIMIYTNDILYDITKPYF